MTRSAFRNLWLLSLVVLAFMAYSFFQKAQKNDKMIYRKNAELARFKIEKQKMHEVSKALEELDERTINELKTTQLSLLRHLGVEEAGYKVSILSKSREDISSIGLFLRQVQIEATLSYQGAMDLMDTLHQSNKIVLHKFTLSPGEGFGDIVKLTMVGTMYGLDKND